MHLLTHVAIVGLFVGIAAAPGTDVARDPFLRPYVEQLKKDTPADELARITAMAESELVLLHHNYGMWIRNRWIHGRREPALVKFFLSQKINHPDDMSTILIEALWRDLNSRLTPEQRASIEKKRATVARKRAAYKQLEAECEAQLKKAQDEFDRLYASNGPPSKNPKLRHPFFQLLVEKSGRVRKIVFFESSSPELKARLAKILNKFRFSAFNDDEFVTLYIIEFPHCGVAERDTLHSE